jgi:hypothetical protein
VLSEANRARKVINKIKERQCWFLCQVTHDEESSDNCKVKETEGDTEKRSCVKCADPGCEN